MTGIITDIQKFSLHDGPGIRTTVFLKGCNMNCAWCHNPETIKFEPQKAYYKEKCIGCGHCNDYCPTGARVTIGKKYSALEVIEEIAADAEYYRNSGGGVTLSGGEPLMQADFAAEILRLCKENGIGTALETNLSLSFEQIRKLIPYLDMVFFDVKLYDETKHKRYTGVSNQRVFENAKLLDQLGIPMVIRTPLIPGVTDTKENIEHIAAFASELKNLQYYELLNYNVLAPSKYELIGEDYTLGVLEQLGNEYLRELVTLAEGTGIKVVCNGE